MFWKSLSSYQDFSLKKKFREFSEALWLLLFQILEMDAIEWKAKVSLFSVRSIPKINSFT